MSGVDEKIVELSGRSVVVLLLGSLAVAGLGAWMISLDPEFIAAFRRLNSPIFIHGFGIFLVLLAGLGVFYGIRKLFGDRRGLVFNDVGVLDCTHGVSAGLIPWREIIGAEIVKLPTQTVLAVKLKEPNKYLERQSPLKQAFFLANHKLCGSPVALSVNLLKAKPAELLAHFSPYQQKYVRSNNAFERTENHRSFDGGCLGHSTRTLRANGEDGVHIWHFDEHGEVARFRHLSIRGSTLSPVADNYWPRRRLTAHRMTVVLEPTAPLRS